MRNVLSTKFDLEEPFHDTGKDPELIDALIPGVVILLLLVAVLWIRNREDKR